MFDATCPRAGQPTSDSVQPGNDWLKPHNDARRSVNRGLSDLKWGNAEAASAQAWANNLRDTKR
jgi:hypothetical protein